MKIAVLADTHIPKRARQLPQKAINIIKQSDLLIHAGDILTAEFLEFLSRIIPVQAVLGNNDLGVSLPEKLEIELEGVKLGIVHDSGPSKGRAGRMKRLFPQADAVVFGHSHIPMNVREEGILLFNPGSATDKRRQPSCTMGTLDVLNGSISGTIVELDQPL
ncbi:MAG TPA: metallophosphoesterase family protein [Candidatus Melainabacteria bacterium]|nr:metallophosphoesterase family protein [Candidatus Melainabacteria bacterium]